MIIVTGQPRCGTSMMMRCLEKAGINMAFEGTRPEEMKKRFRNIHGFYEGNWNGQDGAVKCMRVKRLNDFKDPFFIMMIRDYDKIVKSWKEINNRDFSKVKDKMKKKRKNILDVVSNYSFVKIDYDVFVNTPEAYKEDFENQGIDFNKLIRGIDKDLYISR